MEKRSTSPLRNRHLDPIRYARWMATLILAIVSTPSVRADVTYTYTGNDFTTFVAAPYTTSDYISGSFTVASPLAPSQNGTDITQLVTSFSFTDQVDTVTNTNSSSSFFFVATDATSAITSWNIVLILTGESGIDTENEPGSVIDYGADNAGDNGYRMQDPGNWVMTSSTALPEPQNGLIFLLGVLGIAFVARRRILQSTRQTTQTQQ